MDRVKKARLIFYSLLVILAVLLLGAGSRSSLSYTQICPKCLQEAGGVERSIFGITWSNVVKQRRSESGGFVSYTDGTRIAPIDPGDYLEIAGHPCEHIFLRTGFCRYRSGSVGCGRFGGEQHEFRKDLMVNLYRGFRLIHDQTLARETLELIDRLYPLHVAKASDSAGSGPSIHHAFEVESLPDEPLSILYRGLAMMRDSAEWRQVLNASKAGDGSLGILVDPALLAQRLDHPDPAIRYQLIDQLAALNDPGAWATIANCLNDRQTQDHAARKIVYSGHLEFFEAVFEADERTRAREHAEEKDPVYYTPDIFDQLIRDYSAEEIRRLLVLKRTYLDRIAFAAIRRQSRFEFVDEVLAILNQRPSRSAAATLESLFQGPNPFEPGRTFEGLPRLDPWQDLVANTPMDPDNALTNYTELGRNAIRIRQQIVRLGLQRDPAKWSELQKLYLDPSKWRGDNISSTAIAQAMAESDRTKTLAFLLSLLDLEDSRNEEIVAAIAGLGAIADPGSLDPLLAFLKSVKGTTLKGHPQYQPIIDYALHRCRGSQRWRLVKVSKSSYVIEK